MAVKDRLQAQIDDVKARAQRLAQANVDLAKAEIQAKGKVYGKAFGMLGAGALLALYGLGFLLTMCVILLRDVVPLWAALLIVAVVLFIIAAILALVGRAKLREVKTPRPEAAIEEMNTTITAVRERVLGIKAKARYGAAGPPAPADSGPAESAVPPVDAAPADTNTLVSDVEGAGDAVVDEILPPTDRDVT